MRDGKKIKKILALFLQDEKFNAFWGEQQAVVTFVAAACIFSGIRRIAVFPTPRLPSRSLPQCAATLSTPDVESHP